MTSTTFRTLLLALSISVLSLVFISGCGGGSVSLVGSVHASTPDCTPEFFFDGVQDSGGGGSIETAHTFWAVTPACVITTNVSNAWITRADHDVQLMTIQMGSNQDSVFEWDQVITVISPAGVVLIQQQQQYDKHIDESGNRQERYPYVQPIHIPAGSTVSITRRPQAEASCIHGGKFGDRVDCYTGGGVQFQDVVKVN